uniref:Uncharacterized protein n=1 Tax=Amanita pseudoporphyria TaxID=67725 RepID=A0A5Q0N1Y1_9AGAR|nr:hypothetical protein [Amanita pseudoporphyria]QFZ98506.1 hypothetical protein [Amanita pseudoporphyria]
MVKLINTNIDILKKSIWISLELLVKFISKYFLTETFLSKAYSFQTRLANLNRILILQFYRTTFQTSKGNEENVKKISTKLSTNRYTIFFLTLSKKILKTVYNILYYLISRYKYFILFINVIYILSLVLDSYLDSSISSVLINKFSNIVIISLIKNFISKFIIIFTYLCHLGNISNINITSYDITYVNYLIPFFIIHLTLLLIVIGYLFFLLKIKVLVDNLFIKFLFKQINLIKFLKNSFLIILNLLNLDIMEYYYNFNKVILKNMVTLSLTGNELVLSDQNPEGITSVQNSSPSDDLPGESFSNLTVTDTGDEASELGLDTPLSNSTIAVDSENNLLPTENKNFFELSREDRTKHIINKFEDKGMNVAYYTITWLMEKITLNTDGNLNNVDLLIDSYLLEMLNLERKTKLKSFAFHRDKPFLINLVHKTPLEYPYVIPAKNNLTEADLYDLKDAIFKNGAEILTENSEYEAELKSDEKK